MNAKQEMRSTLIGAVAKSRRLRCIDGPNTGHERHYYLRDPEGHQKFVADMIALVMSSKTFTDEEKHWIIEGVEP